MRRSPVPEIWRWIGTMSLLFVPIACNEADENPLAERISDAEAAALPTPGRLAQALLSPDDMPEGWFKLRIPNNDDDPCDISLARAAGLASDQIPVARTVLAGDRGPGPVLGEFIAALPDDRGPGALDHLTTDIRECDTDMAAGVRYTTRPLQFAQLGDQSVAVRFELDPALQPDATQDTVYVRVDDTIVAVAVLTPGDPATEQNPMLDTWARQAVAKAQRVLELS